MLSFSVSFVHWYTLLSSGEFWGRGGRKGGGERGERELTERKAVYDTNIKDGKDSDDLHRRADGDRMTSSNVFFPTNTIG